jgi:cleavage stimulation factor subunit 3
VSPDLLSLHLSPLTTSRRYLTANYNLKLGQVDEAIAVLQSGMVAIPSSLLLAYTLAELMEGKSEFPACYKIYDDLIVHFHAQVAALEAATEQDINEAMTAIDAAAEDDVAMGDVEEAEGRQKTVQEKEEVKAEIRMKREPEIEEGRKAAANVWITEMRFARRAEVSWMCI